MVRELQLVAHRHSSGWNSAVEEVSSEGTQHMQLEAVHCNHHMADHMQVVGIGTLMPPGATRSLCEL